MFSFSICLFSVFHFHVPFFRFTFFYFPFSNFHFQFIRFPFFYFPFSNFHFSFLYFYFPLSHFSFPMCSFLFFIILRLGFNDVGTLPPAKFARILAPRAMQSPVGCNFDSVCSSTVLEQFFTDLGVCTNAWLPSLLDRFESEAPAMSRQPQPPAPPDASPVEQPASSDSVPSTCCNRTDVVEQVVGSVVVPACDGPDLRQIQDTEADRLLKANRVIAHLRSRAATSKKQLKINRQLVGRLRHKNSKQKKEILRLRKERVDLQFNKGKTQRYMSHDGGLRLAIRTVCSNSGAQSAGLLLGIDVNGTSIRSWKIAARSALMADFQGWQKDGRARLLADVQDAPNGTWACRTHVLRLDATNAKVWQECKLGSMMIEIHDFTEPLHRTMDDPKVPDMVAGRNILCHLQVVKSSTGRGVPFFFGWVRCI